MDIVLDLRGDNAATATRLDRTQMIPNGPSSIRVLQALLPTMLQKLGMGAAKGQRHC